MVKFFGAKSERVTGFFVIIVLFLDSCGLIEMDVSDLSWIESDLQRVIDDGGSFLMTGVTNEQLKCLEGFIDFNKCKLRVSFLNGKLHVSRTSNESGSASCFCSCAVALVNLAASGFSNFPVISRGSAIVNLGGKNFYQPDVQFRAKNRVNRFPNVVFEFNYKVLFLQFITTTVPAVIKIGNEQETLEKM